MGNFAENLNLGNRVRPPLIVASPGCGVAKEEEEEEKMKRLKK